MKKDIFKGKIKKEYISVIWTSIILSAVIFFGCGGLFLYSSFYVLDKATSVCLLVFGVVSCLLGIWYSFGTIFIIRKYPKYKKRINWFLNSEYYFVGCDLAEFRGHWRGRSAFKMAARLAARNKGLEDIKYPKQYRVFIILTVIGIVLLFANVVGVWLALENINTLPELFQNEFYIFAAFVAIEIIDTILSFVFAFKVKSIRYATIKEYRKTLNK